VPSLNQRALLAQLPLWIGARRSGSGVPGTRFRFGWHYPALEALGYFRMSLPGQECESPFPDRTGARGVEFDATREFPLRWGVNSWFSQKRREVGHPLNANP
jgi:hypothetical protein